MNTLRALGYLRPLNRRTTEHLFLGSDGHSYTVNVDETWGDDPSILRALGSRLCQSAGIDTVAPALLTIDPDILRSGAVSSSIAGDIFLARRYPVDPATTAVYDFLPDGLLQRVENRGDFWKLIPIDLWLGNLRASKTVFFREIPGGQSYRSAIVFRTTPDRELRGEPRSDHEGLPLLAVRHYCGTGGFESAHKTVAQLFAMTVADLEGLLYDLPGYAIDRCGTTTTSIASDLVAARDSLFRDFYAKLQALQHRVNAAESERRGPHTAVSTALNQTLGATG
jgi:hypothetical protein